MKNIAYIWWYDNRLIGVADMPSWNFITNHGAILIIVSQQRKITAREISQQLGITERAVLRIVADLDDAGYITRTRQGRTNTYIVNQELPLPGPLLKDIAVGDLLDILETSSPESK
ncbi:MAG: winged helix-turn-helix domain-containing protein [Dehalococcoidia bacterium]|jgi:DNA-binding IscR family transcriptional regulator|nr:winged helix-turn-helix domain-containing protein [Dehalococcoidia bacterium]